MIRSGDLAAPEVFESAESAITDGRKAFVEFLQNNAGVPASDVVVSLKEEITDWRGRLDRYLVVGCETIPKVRACAPHLRSGSLLTHAGLAWLHGLSSSNQGRTHRSGREI